MADSIERDDLLEALLFLMEETFEGHPTPGNVYLDRGTGWNATLEGISAPEASLSAYPGGTTIAGHVEHTRYYLAVLREFVAGRTEKVDWRESWKVQAVSDGEWNSLRNALTEESGATRELMRKNDEWGSDVLGSAIGLIAHCSYHLGAVRQMIKVVRD